MAGRLSKVASTIMGGNGVVGRSVASSLRLRSGMGLPVGKHIVPDKPVSTSTPVFQIPMFLVLGSPNNVVPVLALSASCQRRAGLGQRDRISRALYRSHRGYSWKGNNSSIHELHF
jgi:hypothetical protein